MTPVGTNSTWETNGAFLNLLHSKVKRLMLRRNYKYENEKFLLINLMEEKQILLKTLIYYKSKNFKN